MCDQVINTAGLPRSTLSQLSNDRDRPKAVHGLSAANDRFLVSYLLAIYLLDLIAASHGILHRYLACGLKLLDGLTSKCGINLGI